MSMIGNFLLLPDADVDGLLGAPASVHDLLRERVYEVDPPDGYVDVDKAWHCLHFLLTGTAWEGAPPLDFIATGGTAIGDEDVGYGPARVLRATEVAELNTLLEPLPSEVLVRRLDAALTESLEIYPQGWKELETTPDSLGYFTDAYEQLRALVQRGARERQALLTWIA
jgi:hypothetical protein